MLPTPTMPIFSAIACLLPSPPGRTADAMRPRLSPAPWPAFYAPLLTRSTARTAAEAGGNVGPGLVPYRPAVLATAGLGNGARSTAPPGAQANAAPPGGGGGATAAGRCEEQRARAGHGPPRR